MTHEPTDPVDPSLAALMETQALQALFAKTSYLLRESRKALLQRHAVAGEADLLERIKHAQVAEHPAYEHYLSALIIEQTRMQIRAELAAHMRYGAQADLPSISVHLLFKEKLETHYAARLAEPIRMAQDALLMSFDTGLMLEVRYFSNREYSIKSCWGEAELRIDTAPAHPRCATFPNHLHGADGALLPDPATSPGTDCWLDFSGLLDILLANPLLANPLPHAPGALPAVGAYAATDRAAGTG